MKFYRGWTPLKMLLAATEKNPLLASPLEKILPTPMGGTLIMPSVASSVRRNDRKLICLLLSCGFYVFFCNGLTDKTRGSFKTMCHDINYSRKYQWQSVLIYEHVVVFG